MVYYTGQTRENMSTPAVSKTAHFCFPPPGMPPQKGPFCAYYALQTIANGQRNETIDKAITIYKEASLASQDLQTKIAAHKQLLSNLNLTHEIDSYKLHDVDSSPNASQECISKMTTLEGVITAYGFKDISWNPYCPIDELITQLETFGPLFGWGRFGSTFYSTPPVLLPESIEGRPLYEWKEKPCPYLADDDIHAVILVGAKEEGSSSSVYFLDPIDGSSINDPTTQKVYECSYSLFVDSIANSLSFLYFDEDGMRIYDMDDNNVYLRYLPRAK